VHALRALGAVSLTTSSFEDLDLDAAFSASAFPWEVEPTKYELSSNTTHLGVATIK
jgi:hypothetical protein